MDNSQLMIDRELLIKIKEKADDDFEKNITYISAGTLVLSLTFIEKIVVISQTEFLWTLIVSWILLAITLLVNLISHQLSSIYHEKTIDELNLDRRIQAIKINRRNKCISCLNWSTIISLIFGIVFLILFCSINAYNMAKITKNIKPLNNPNLETRGRTITVPSSVARPTVTSASGTSTSGSTQETTKPDTSKK